MLKRLIKRSLKIIHSKTLCFFNRDPVSKAKITSRVPLHTVGSKYGGWVIPKDGLTKNSVCYCVGCGEDISFDLELIEKYGCIVHALDPTPRSIEYVNKTAGHIGNFKFIPFGLWDNADTLKFYVPKNTKHISHSFVNLQKTNEYIEVPVIRLKDLISKNQHQKLDLLKLDIEGSEYKVIDTIIEDNIYIKILCIEFDEYFHPLDNNYVNRITKYVNKLIKLGYDLVHTNGNGNYTFVKSI